MCITSPLRPFDEEKADPYVEERTFSLLGAAVRRVHFKDKVSRGVHDST